MAFCEICFVDSNLPEDLVKLENCKHHYCSECLVTTLKANENYPNYIECPIDKLINKNVMKHGSNLNTSLYDYVLSILPSRQIEDGNILSDLIDRYITLNLEAFNSELGIYHQFIEILNNYNNQELSLSELRTLLNDKYFQYDNQMYNLWKIQNEVHFNYLKINLFNIVYDSNSIYIDCFISQHYWIDFFKPYDYRKLNENNINDYIEFLENEKSIVNKYEKIIRVYLLFDGPQYYRSIELFSGLSQCPICEADITETNEFIKLKNNPMKICMNCCVDTYLVIKPCLENSDNDNQLKKLFYGNLTFILNKCYKNLRDYLVKEFNNSLNQDFYSRIFNLNLIGEDWRTLTQPDINIFSISIFKTVFERLNSHLNVGKLKEISLDVEEIDEIRRLIEKCEFLCKLYKDCIDYRNLDYLEIRYTVIKYNKFKHLLDEEIRSYFDLIMK